MPEQPLDPAARFSAAPDLRAGVLARLERRRVALAAQAPLTALRDPKWEVRAAAAHALGELASGASADEPLSLASLTNAYAMLSDALCDEHRLVRGAAIRALGRVAATLARHPNPQS